MCELMRKNTGYHSTPLLCDSSRRTSVIGHRSSYIGPVIFLYPLQPKTVWAMGRFDPRVTWVTFLGHLLGSSTLVPATENDKCEILKKLIQNL